MPSLFGFQLLTDLLVFALLGGLASPLGPVFGAVFVSTMPEWLADFDAYREAIIGVLLILAVVYTPGGLVQIVRVVRRWIRARWYTGRRAEPMPERDVALSDLVTLKASTSNDSGALQVRSMSKSFGGLKALTNIDLDIAPGEIVALIGPNGAGKTTLVNCLTGLDTVDEGSILVSGRSVDQLRADQRSGDARLVRTFQTPRVLPDLSVVDNVLVGLHPTACESMWRSVLYGA
ncbi:MAG: ATP-binding cassette domain-containing protein, partial [Actinobacteria bacterium]|nr:ATP-binding cassette domain-containing protein [Actinomycetota bacterium]